MRRKLTIALLGAVAALAMGAPLAHAAKRPPATALVSDKAKSAAVVGPAVKVAQYDGSYKRRFRPRPRRWGGGMVRQTYGRRYISMREAVAIVRSRYPGRILHAGLRGRNWWFRIIYRGRVRDVYIPRLRAGRR